MDDQTVEQVIGILAQEFDQCRCVPFVGSGASASHEDHRGKKHTGVPMPQEIVQKLTNTTLLVNEKMPFLQALSLAEMDIGKAKVQEIIGDMIPLCKDPLPTHLEIAKLPTEAIITTNWDDYMEVALRQHGIDPRVIITDKDIFTKRAGSLPIIKFHGTIQSLESVIGSFKDAYDALHNRPILSSWLRVLCAEHTLLFIGYSLGDPNFQEVFASVRRALGELMRQSYAIQLNPSPEIVRFWKHNGVKIIASDAYPFLRQLNEKIRVLNSVINEVTPIANEFSDSPYYLRLIESGTRSSEGDVIAAFLEALTELLDSVVDLSRAKKMWNEALEILIQTRPRHEALLSLKTEIALLQDRKKRRSQCKTQIRKIIKKRRAATESISKKCRKQIDKNDQLLLFAKSTKVIEGINMWLADNKSESNGLQIYICECRPKSPTPFKEAMEVADSINPGEHSMLFLSENEVPSLIRDKRITKVLLGAHCILMEQVSHQRFRVFNPPGVLMIATFAAAHNVPILVFAEEDKLKKVDRFDDVEVLPEDSRIEQWLVPANERKNMKLDQMGIQLIHHGYEYIDSDDVAVKIFTEKRSLC